MTDKELFIQTITDEIPRFERVINAIPAERRDYRPDPKSKTAMELAATMAAEATTFIEFLTKGAFDWATLKKPEGKEPAELAAILTQALGAAKDAAGKMSDAEWMAEAKMLMGGKEEWKAPRGPMVFSLILDEIHHRGQLSTYLRPMGGKVPSIYGPSADSGE
ncbi:MAG: hypothetical protein RL681_404 [Candidatus Parcubacteria bacterium]|jgi:uncharacterized damage-inducible protein DinB